jgi:hypothetical protein
LLRQTLKAPQEAIADSCLDAETLAAWMDGGLSGAALAVAQSHVADCARCQTLVGALARTAAMVPAPEPARRRWLVWLVPLTAASAAVAVWFVVPRVGNVPLPPLADVRAPAAEGKAPGPGSADKEASAPTPPPDVAFAKTEQATTALNDGATANRVQESQPQEAQLQKDSGALKSAAAAAPPAALEARQEANTRPTDALAARVSARIDIVSPDARTRWRLAGPVVEHSTDGGSTWNTVFMLAGAEFTSGAAPSASTCWVIGRRGVVLRSTDGRTFALVIFPVMTDLSAVKATDARSASVSTVDGRTFSTTDGGATWRRQ